MRAYLLCVGLFLGGALPVAAGEADPEIFFPNATDQSLSVRRFSDDLDPSANNCSSMGGRRCDDIYSLEYVGTEVDFTSVQSPSIISAQVDPVSGFLNLDLSGPIQLNQAGTTLPLSSFRLVLRQIRFQNNPKPNRFDISLAPTFFVDPDANARALIYRGLRFRTRPVGAVVVTLRDPATSTTIVYDHAEVNPYPQKESNGNLLWHIRLKPSPPRGKPLQISVVGIDDFQGGAITRGEAITFAAFPKGRDDAKFYLRGQKVYNQKGDDQGSIDFKNERIFFSPSESRELWYLVSATVGSKKLNLSQTGTASVGYRQWLGVDPMNFTKNVEWAISFAPTFRTDRDFKNRDLGLDIALTGEPAFLYFPLERRRKEAANPQEAARIATGWWIKPKLAIEAGEHLASAADSVEGETFARGVVGLNLMWETDRVSLFDRIATLKLTVDWAARYLTEDEVTLSQSNVLKIEDGHKPYLRAELAYDLGFAGLSVVHENGKLPPAFKTARATTVGLTFKF